MFNPKEFKIIRDFVSVIKRARPHADVRALDVACGTGRLSSVLLENGFQVTACDLSANMLNQFKEELSEKALKNITFHSSDITEFLTACDEEYDCVVMGAFLHHVSDIYGLLPQVIRVLKTGGFLLIVHDPALRESANVLTRFVLEKIDSLLFQLCYFTRFLRFLPRTKSYASAEVHTRSGIDDDELCSWLMKRGLSIVDHERYFVHKTGLISWVDAHITKALPQFFISAQKISS